MNRNESRQKLRRPFWIFALLPALLLSLLAGYSAIAAKPVMSLQGDHYRVDQLRGQRYCEVLLIDGGILGGMQAIVYNTFGLNECPQTEWQQLSADAIREDRNVRHAALNGPRHFLADGIMLPAQHAGSMRAPRVESFGSLELRRVAVLELPLLQILRGGVTAYEELHVKRRNVWLFDQGNKVYELINPEGQIYRMQSYSLMIDPDQSVADLDTLGSRLQLPEGWSYRARVLDQDRQVATQDGTATVLTDDFKNTYQLTEARAR